MIPVEARDPNVLQMQLQYQTDRWIQQGKQVGALIVGPEENLRVVVQAHAKECTSVLMAEATAMTFASRITISLQ
jgi:hypothetical protein